MGLRSVLVDRARTVRRAPTPLKVEGRTAFADVKGEWFRARLDLRGYPQTRDPGSRAKTIKTPSLMFATKDLVGGAIEVRATDRIEVRSVQLGDATWEVTGSPEPWRKKRLVIGYQVPVRRVDEEQVDMSGAGVA